MGDSAYFFQNPVVFQQAGTTQGWTWAVGDPDNYYGYSVRPWSDNARIWVHSIVSWSSNAGNHYVDFSVEAHSTYDRDPNNPPDTGVVGLRFTAIRVPD
jgi:hypothetical protein